MSQRLSSLEIVGFRALKHLHVPRLADVNLIVGKNSVGKTTILEAVRLLLSADIRPRLYSILADREEWSMQRRHGSTDRNAWAGADISFEALFYGRPNLSGDARFRISGGPNEPNLSIGFGWLRQERRDDASVLYLPSEGPFDDPDAVPGLRAERDSISAVLPLDRINRIIARRALREAPRPNVTYIGSNGLDFEEIGQLWDSVALTDDEEKVIESLKIISPTLEKLVMVQSPEARAERMLMAKVSEFDIPIPFKSLGEGAMHLLSIALGIIQARGSALLIDEISSGIHYSAQAMVWDMIFSQCEKYNIQIFATTHSWDCVRALHKAGSNNRGSTVALHRLERVSDRVKVVSFSRDELEIVAADEIEVR
jgi:ABC-type branched-subunit amino acid transport system ATPase component